MHNEDVKIWIMEDHVALSLQNSVSMLPVATALLWNLMHMCDSINCKCSRQTEQSWSTTLSVWQSRIAQSALNAYNLYCHTHTHMHYISWMDGLTRARNVILRNLRSVRQQNINTNLWYQCWILYVSTYRFLHFKKTDEKNKQLNLVAGFLLLFSFTPQNKFSEKTILRQLKMNVLLSSLE